MIPGRNIYRICTECQGTLIQRTISSGNSFGGRFWTDGWRSTPMLPLLPWLVECPHCHALLWLDELPSTGEAEWDVPETAPCACEPMPGRIQELVDGANLTREQELHARRCLWWAGNHLRRDNPDSAPLSDKERVNLVALLPLFDGRTGEGRISRGEVLRELGDFEQATRILGRRFDQRLEPVACFIRDEIQAGKASVAELWPMPRPCR